MANKAIHWADIAAERIIRERGDKDLYTCASGITPSGTVHIGNFREIISVELVVRALRDLGKNVRFIYSWDDYDVFRKVPKDMPNREDLEQYLRQPITKVPDTRGAETSYARANEKALEAVLPVLGVEPEYIYQSEKYAAATYADGIRKAYQHEDIVRGILNEHRTSPLADDWSPVSVFCSVCSRDTTQVVGWDGEANVHYTCESCGNNETVDINKPSGVKLPWRIDWPMRWAFEDVDFEPAGKEHHSAGGSFDTAKRIVKEVYDAEPPVTFKYDFISVKGMGGKISSSLGNVISLPDVLEVYQPEVVRYLFAGTRPNAEFAISFDLDVIKIYEDYDRNERVYFGIDEVSEKKREKEKRIYELSQVGEVPAEPPLQAGFRHLCTMVQIYSGDVEKTIASIDGVTEADRERLTTRTVCAKNWVAKYAPEDFTFTLRTVDQGTADIPAESLSAVHGLRAKLMEDFDSYDDKSLAELIYEIAHENGIEPKEFFKTMYLILLGKEKGPRLAAFLRILGEEIVVPLLNLY